MPGGVGDGLADESWWQRHANRCGSELQKCLERLLLSQGGVRRQVDRGSRPKEDDGCTGSTDEDRCRAPALGEEGRDRRRNEAISRSER